MGKRHKFRIMDVESNSSSASSSDDTSPDKARRRKRRSRSSVNARKTKDKDNIRMMVEQLNEQMGNLIESQNDQSKEMKRLIESQNDQSKEMKRLIESQNGQSKVLEKLIESQNGQSKELEKLTACITKYLGKQLEFHTNITGHAESNAPRSQMNQVPPPRYQLVFRFAPTDKIETGKTIKITVALVEAISGRPVEDGPLASITVELVVVNSKFNQYDNQHNWSREDFERNIVKPRCENSAAGGADQSVKSIVSNGRFNLDRGVGCYSGSAIFENSHNRKVRLAAMAVFPTEERVLEALSNPLLVRDHVQSGKQSNLHPNSSNGQSNMHPNSSNGQIDDGGAMFEEYLHRENTTHMGNGHVLGPAMDMQFPRTMPVQLVWDRPNVGPIKRDWNLLDQLMRLPKFSNCGGLPTKRLMQEHLVYSRTIMSKEVMQARRNTGVIIEPLEPDDSDDERQLKRKMRRKYQLRFVNKVCEGYHIMNPIKADDGSLLKVALFDGNRKITNGPLSSASVQITALHGDFNDHGLDYWTSEEFNCYEVCPWPGEEASLVLGGYDCILVLSDGEACLGDVFFQMVSYCARTAKFKLGARLASAQEERIQEAVSESFWVKDHHYAGECGLGIGPEDDTARINHPSVVQATMAELVTGPLLYTLKNKASSYRYNVMEEGMEDVLDDGTFLHDIADAVEEADGKLKEINERRRRYGLDGRVAMATPAATPSSMVLMQEHLVSRTIMSKEVMQARPNTGVIIEPLEPDDSDEGRQLKRKMCSKYQLRFVNKVCEGYHIMDPIKADDGNPLKVALFDGNRKITNGPLSSAPVKIVALHGDFNDHGQDYFTSEEFNSCEVCPQPGEEASSVLGGDCILVLSDGEACLGDAFFQMTSYCARTGKFKMGVKLASPQEERIQGVSESFWVTDRHCPGECGLGIGPEDDTARINHPSVVQASSLPPRPMSSAYASRHRGSGMSTTTVRAAKVAFASAALLAAAASFARLAVPQLVSVAGAVLPRAWTVARFWLVPPYLFVTVHLIILVIWKLSDHKHFHQAQAPHHKDPWPVSQHHAPHPAPAAVPSSDSDVAAPAAAVKAKEEFDFSAGDGEPLEREFSPDSGGGESCVTTESDEDATSSPSYVTDVRRSRAPAHQHAVLEREPSLPSQTLDCDGDDDLDATWKAIMQKTRPAAAAAPAPAPPPPAQQSPQRPPPRARDPSVGAEEMNRRFDDFIKKNRNSFGRQ